MNGVHNFSHFFENLFIYSFDFSKKTLRSQVKKPQSDGGSALAAFSFLEAYIKKF